MKTLNKANGNLRGVNITWRDDGTYREDSEQVQGWPVYLEPNKSGFTIVAGPNNGNGFELILSEDAIFRMLTTICDNLHEKE